MRLMFTTGKGKRARIFASHVVKNPGGQASSLGGNGSASASALRRRFSFCVVVVTLRERTVSAAGVLEVSTYHPRMPKGTTVFLLAAEDPVPWTGEGCPLTFLKEHCLDWALVTCDKKEPTTGSAQGQKGRVAFRVDRCAWSSGRKSDFRLVGLACWPLGPVPKQSTKRKRVSC
jgi:hypothetical protein